MVSSRILNKEAKVMSHQLEDQYPDCKCGVVMRIWNLDPERYPFRQNWLSQNVPSVFEEVNKSQDEEGLPVHILRCKDCGHEIRVPVG